MSFEEAYKEFLIYASKRHKKQSFDCLEYNSKSNIYSFFKSYDLSDIDIFLLNDWRDFILSKGFCNNHNKNLYSMLKSILTFCSSRYDFNINIDDFLPFPLKVENSSSDYYTYKEFKKFIKFVDHIVYKTFFDFLFFTGLRPGEAMALKFSDLKPFSILVNKTIDEHGNREIGTPKTISSVREVSIDKRLYYNLLNLKDFYDCSSLDYFIFGGIEPIK